MRNNKLHNVYKLLTLVIGVILFFWVDPLQAQTLTDLQNGFNIKQKTALHEKLYVHVSKTSFVTGETLWFKIYNTDGSNNNLLNLSKVAYVEILDNANTPVLQAKIALNNGTGNGSFLLPQSLNTGNYTVRAYTNWMKNFAPEFYFSQAVSIINPLKEVVKNDSVKTTGYNIQFLPEGGHLVKGVSSRVAFKILGADGKPVDATGAVLDQRKDTIARFSTLKFGMGSFIFTPTASIEYKAIIKLGKNQVVAALPAVNDAGYVIQVTNNNNNYGVDIRTAGISPGNIYLLIHTNNAIELAESAAIANGSAHFTIDKSKLAEGVSYVTIFNEQKQPVCERLLFNRPQRQLIVKAMADASSYTTRKKVAVNVGTQSEDAKNIPANLSLAVYRLTGSQNLQNSDIASYLWLSADLKGAIESPGYYLENNTPESNQALDNLLLSQGWTQFDWSNILSAKTAQYNYLPEYTGPIITANIINTVTSIAAPNINAYLTVPGKYHQLYAARSDSAGKLTFNTKGAYGSKDIIVKTNNRIDSTYRIDVLSPFSEQYTAQALPILGIDATLKNTLSADNINAQVNQLFTRSETEPLVADSTNFYKKPFYAYNLDDYVRFKTIEEIIHEYVRFISVSYTHNLPHLTMSYNKELLKGQALAVVDGEPIFESGEIYKLDPLKFKRLDVINDTYLYGPAVFDGIIGLTSYNGDKGNIVLDPKAVTVDYEGLQLRRIFYSPVYDTQQQQKNTIPDFRTTLYWNPDVTTGADGTGKVNFYTSDKPGAYIGIIEGITPTGRAGTGKFYFEVKK